MRAGKLLLSGLVITGCMSLVAGCSSAPPKKSGEGNSAQAQLKQQQPAGTEYVIRNEAVDSVQQLPKGLPLQQSSQNNQYAAKKAEQERLRQQRQQEWEAKQRQEKLRAEYRKKWEQKQKQQAAGKVSQDHRQANLQPLQWQQEAKRQQYQQQWQQKQRVQQQQARRAAPVAKGYGGRGVGNYSAAALSGDFAGNPALVSFINRMSARHGFSKNYLYGVFSQTRNRDVVARLWAGNNGGSSSGGRGWYNYRSKFVTPGNVQKGAQFWNQYRPHIQRASQRYGVDPEYIVGIMGVETRWGRILGKHRVIDALTTSAIVNKRRSKFFFKELENYLLMTRSERMDPLQPKGSYAGAMGYGQFMPSSFRAFAVDFDGDGIRDLWNPVDAIGSIANYFAKHGWKRGQEVAVPAKVTSMAYTGMPDGFKVKYSPSRLAKQGIRPRSGNWSNTGRTHLLALTTVPGGIKEPWIGYHNFYVITRYNHSNYYAMAVHQLAKDVKRKVGGGQYASR